MGLYVLCLNCLGYGSELSLNYNALLSGRNFVELLPAFGCLTWLSSWATNLLSSSECRLSGVKVDRRFYRLGSGEVGSYRILSVDDVAVQLFAGS